MKTTAEIRRENFRALAAKAGSPEAFAELIGKHRSQVYAWLADPSAAQSRNIGPTSRREIEAALGLETAWMDHEHPELFGKGDAPASQSASQVGRIDPDRLRFAMDILADLAQEQIGPDSGGFAHDARHIAITYNYLLARNEPVDQSNVTEIRRGVAARIRSELSSATQEERAA